MQTIVVAGGAGFIGSNFARQALAQTDCRVVVYDKLTYAGSLLNLAGCGRTIVSPSSRATSPMRVN